MGGTAFGVDFSCEGELADDVQDIKEGVDLMVGMNNRENLAAYEVAGMLGCGAVQK